VACFVTGLASAAEATTATTGVAVWDRSFDLRTGVGYKDNVLLGSNVREGSAFETTGLDVMLIRLSTSDTLFNFLLSGDDTRFLQAKDVDKEQSVIAQAQLKQGFGNEWKGAFTVQYFYQNQVYDASITETNFTPVKARGHNLSLRPSVRRALPKNFWLELELAAQRQWFAAPLPTYWQGGPKITVGRDLTHQSDLTLSYSINRRAYDDFNQIALIDGEPTALANTTEGFWIHEVELAWHRNWDEKRHWRSTTRLSYALNRDNGTGFFDYWSYRFVQQLRYHSDPWQIEGRAAISRYDFDHQTVSPADSSARHKTDVTVSLRGERQLLKSLKAFAEYAYERSVSNLAFDNYHVHQVTGGVDWEF
jgi:hypothetical protein